MKISEDKAKGEFRAHSGIAVESRANGRVRGLLTCPFCESDVTVYVWSLAGSGKRCDCGALLMSFSAWRMAFSSEEPRP